MVSLMGTPRGTSSPSTRCGTCVRAVVGPRQPEALQSWAEDHIVHSVRSCELSELLMKPQQALDSLLILQGQLGAVQEENGQWPAPPSSHPAPASENRTKQLPLTLKQPGQRDPHPVLSSQSSWQDEAKHNPPAPGRPWSPD